MKYLKRESSTLEFKREIPQNEQIIKTIIGFCNHHGGTLVLGVENDGTIVGVPENDVQRLLEYIEKSILEASHPPIIPSVYAQAIADKTLVLIEVVEGMNKPYFLKKDGCAKGVYVRLGRSTVRANEEMIVELQWDSRRISFDTMPVYRATEDDLDTIKIKEFLFSRKNAAQAKIEDAMHAYSIITKDQTNIYPTISGILLFGKNPQLFYSEARIMCNHFPGVEIGGEVIASKECLGTLDEQFRAACNFIFGCLNKSWKIVGMQRIESLEIPEEAIREIVMNAVIHRNYHMQSPIKIAIFDNRIEIFSPGIFPKPLANNLRAGFTHLRNSTICKIFREIGLIENFGLGFITTFASYEKAGLKAPVVIEGEHWIKCILPRRVPQNLLSEAKCIDQDLDAILNLFSTAIEISVADVIQTLYFQRSTATRKLAILVKKGLIEKIGKGRGVRYIRSALS